MFRSTRTLLGLLTTLVLVAAPAAAVKRRAFVTSVSGTGDLSSWPAAGGQTGLAAGDAICRSRATAAGLPNASTYRAWLSTSSTDAYCHVRGLTGKRVPGCSGGAGVPAGPWYLVNGITAFTADLDGLTGPEGKIYRPVALDEFGDAPPDLDSSRYWTGSNADGTAISVHCSNWTTDQYPATGTTGTAFGTTQVWSSGLGPSCNQSSRLLCLEPGASETVAMRWSSPGSIVFVSTAQGTGNLGSWPEAGDSTGIAAGDAICRNLASAAHLPAPESFVAWLSDSLEDAADRVTTNGPFRRIDGLAIANSKADLLDGATSTTIHVDELGRYLVGGGGRPVATGTDAAGIGVSNASCLDWTSSSTGQIGSNGLAGLARSSAWTGYDSPNCSVSRRLYCFSNVVTIFWDGFDLTGDATRWSSVTP